MTKLVYAIADLDELFGYRVQGPRGGSWWAKHWQGMVAEYQFPAPLPGFGQPRWAVAAVRAWIAVHGGLAPLRQKLTGREKAAELALNLAALDRAS